MRQSHAAGDKLFVDYAGDGVLVVIDRLTGERRTAQIFVAVLGASSFDLDAGARRLDQRPRRRLRGDRRRAGAAGMRHRMPRPWYPMKWRPQFSPELGPFDGLTRAVSEPVASP
jgi:hypothetical protein